MSNEILMSPIMLALMSGIAAVVIMYIWMKHTSTSENDAAMDKSIYIAVFFITTAIVYGIQSMGLGNQITESVVNSVNSASSMVSDSSTIPTQSMIPQMELETGLPKF